MAVYLGKQIVCDRCGKTDFLKFLERVSTDGGHGHYDEYEKNEDWLHITQIGDLCPNCATEFKRFVTGFTAGKVAPIWDLNYIREEK